MKKEAAASADGEGYDSSNATAAAATLTRHSGGNAFASIARVTHPEQKSQRCDIERSTTIGESQEPFSVDYGGNASSVERVGKTTTNSTGAKSTTSAQKSQGNLVRIKKEAPSVVNPRHQLPSIMLALPLRLKRQIRLRWLSDERCIAQVRCCVNCLYVAYGNRRKGGSENGNSSIYNGERYTSSSKRSTSKDVCFTSETGKAVYRDADRGADRDFGGRAA